MSDEKALMPAHQMRQIASCYRRLRSILDRAVHAARLGEFSIEEQATRIDPVIPEELTRLGYKITRIEKVPSTFHGGVSDDVVNDPPKEPYIIIAWN